MVGASDMTASGCSLAELARRTPARITGVAAEDASELARQGVAVGVTLEIEARAPFGGPLVVIARSARLAIPRVIAGRITVAPIVPGAAPDR